MKTSLLSPLVFFVASAALPLASFGAATAWDVASDPAYNTAWTSGSNGGYGFASWTLTHGAANSGFFPGSSQGNGNADGNIDTSGKSFGMFANTGESADAVRPFTAGGSNGTAILDLNQEFSLSLDTGFIDAGGTVGFGLQNSGGTNRIQLYFISGDPHYTINVNNSILDTGISFTSAGLDIAFRQGAADTWSMSVTPNGGSTTVFTNVSLGISGTAVGLLVASDISQVHVFNSNAGPGATHDAFVNKLKVVPEPSAMGLMAVSLAGWLAARRRRN